MTVILKIVAQPFVVIGRSAVAPCIDFRAQVCMIADQTTAVISRGQRILHIGTTRRLTSVSPIFVAMIICLRLTCVGNAQSKGLEVEENQFCKNIRNPYIVEGPLEGIATLDRGEPLWLYLKIKITDAGMDALEKEKRLPLRAVWRTGGALGSVYAQPDIGLSRKTWENQKAGFEYEASRGYADFRTKTRISRPISTKYYVELIDAKGGVLRTADTLERFQSMIQVKLREVKANE